MQIGLHNQILALVNGGSDDEAVSKQNMDSEDDENNSFGSNIYSGSDPWNKPDVEFTKWSVKMAVMAGSSCSKQPFTSSSR